jgi:hypothetical protein
VDLSPRNPNVVAIYKDYGSKVLMVGVSLDKRCQSLERCNCKDKLTWSHVSNLKFWDEPIAIQYKVESIPATFILDASETLLQKI